MREVTAVKDIKQLPQSAVYDVVLSCGDQRQIVINLRRPRPVQYAVPVFGEEETEESA